MRNPYTNTHKVYSKHNNNMLKNKTYSNKDLFKGTKVEFEHTTDKKVARQIAKTHLEENPNYYKYYNPKSSNREFLVN